MIVWYEFAFWKINWSEFHCKIIALILKKTVSIHAISWSFLFLIRKNSEIINQQKLNIIEDNIAVVNTQIKGKKNIEVDIEPKKDPIVEKNNNFHIFSQELLHFNKDDNSGILWDARNTGTKNKKNDVNNIETK